MLNKKPTSRFTLVGAGPGDPELITIKAVRALQEADVVLYDALVNKVLLQHATKAVHIFVGKIPGTHKHNQEDINQMIVDYALSHGHVVRLKGGDPFVFGRASEEISHAEAFGISIEVVPGISSAIAVPASVGISPSLRKVSESFWVITGTTSTHALSNDIRLAAQSSATVIILMGMRKLAQIVQIFKSEGKEEMPVAIIQNGTTEHEKVGVGTIGDIEEVVVNEKLSSPAVIVVGEVVKKSHQLKHFYEEFLCVDAFEDRFLN